MTIWDIFSKRQKRARGELPDVYQYDSFPEPLRVQVVHIITDASGRDTYSSQGVVGNAYQASQQALCREYGVFTLADGQDPGTDFLRFILDADTSEKVLDALEVHLEVLERMQGNYYFENAEGRTLSVPDAVDELNQRFRWHGVGYEIVNRKAIRVDSQLLHQTAVRPLLQLLADRRFQGPQDEFLAAHAHYREGRLKEAMNECLKALESTLKVVCDLKGWKHERNATASKLIAICFENNLIPDYLQSELASLRATLESGVPTLRNRESGHGQGPTPRRVSQEIAEYVLHLTASTMLLISRAALA